MWRQSAVSFWSSVSCITAGMRTSRVSSGSLSLHQRTAANHRHCSTTLVETALVLFVASSYCLMGFTIPPWFFVPRQSFYINPISCLQLISYNLSVCPGLSIPVPRGRKGKRVKAQSTFDVQKVEWIRKYNPDTLLIDDSYRKHLKHQCNK